MITLPRTVLYRVHSANSIHRVAPFLRMAHLLIDKERAGEYPGGRERRFQRYAWFGGMVTFWTKRALRAHLYRDALKLVADGWAMILAAVVRRSVVRLLGRQPIKAIELSPDQKC